MKAHKQVDCIVVPYPPMAMRRNIRLAPRTSHLGVLKDFHKLEGEEEFIESKTEDMYSRSEFCGPSPWMHSWFRV